MAKITIDGKEYQSEDLDVKTKELISAINYCDVKIRDMNLEISVMKTARSGYVSALKRKLDEMEKTEN